MVWLLGSRQFQVECSYLSLSACKSTNFKCADGRCIDQSLRCDGRVDCANGDDEFNCSWYHSATWLGPDHNQLLQLMQQHRTCYQAYFKKGQAISPDVYDADCIRW